MTERLMQVVMHHVNKSVTEVTKVRHSATHTGSPWLNLSHIVVSYEGNNCMQRHAGSMITNLRCDHFGGQKVIVATSTKGVFVCHPDIQEKKQAFTAWFWNLMCVVTSFFAHMCRCGMQL